VAAGAAGFDTSHLSCTRSSLALRVTPAIITPARNWGHFMSEFKCKFNRRPHGVLVTAPLVPPAPTCGAHDSPQAASCPRAWADQPRPRRRRRACGKLQRCTARAKAKAEAAVAVVVVASLAVALHCEAPAGTGLATGTRRTRRATSTELDTRTCPHWRGRWAACAAPRARRATVLQAVQRTPASCAAAHAPRPPGAASPPSSTAPVPPRLRLARGGQPRRFILGGRVVLDPGETWPGAPVPVPVPVVGLKLLVLVASAACCCLWATAVKCGGTAKRWLWHQRATAGSATLAAAQVPADSPAARAAERSRRAQNAPFGMESPCGHGPARLQQWRRPTLSLAPWCGSRNSCESENEASSLHVCSPRSKARAGSSVPAAGSPRGLPSPFNTPRSHAVSQSV